MTQDTRDYVAADSTRRFPETQDNRVNDPALEDGALRGGEPIPPMRADKHTDSDPAVQTPVEARQGFLGVPVLMVLGCGLALAAVAWLAVALTV